MKTATVRNERIDRRLSKYISLDDDGTGHELVACDPVWGCNANGKPYVADGNTTIEPVDVQPGTGYRQNYKVCKWRMSNNRVGNFTYNTLETAYHVATALRKVGA